MASITIEERLSRLEGVYEHLATKTDIANLKTDMANLEADVKSDIANLRTDFRDMEVRLTRWMIGGMAVWAAVIIGGLRILGG